VVELADTPS